MKKKSLLIFLMTGALTLSGMQPAFAEADFAEETADFMEFAEESDLPSLYEEENDLISIPIEDVTEEDFFIDDFADESILFAEGTSSSAAADSEDKSIIHSLDYTYRLNSDDTATLLGYDKTIDGVFSIPYMIDNHSITAIGDSAFMDRTDITSLIIPGSIKSIGDYAFYGTSIQKIKLPEGIVSVGTEAFKSKFYYGTGDYTYEDILDLEVIELPLSLKQLDLDLSDSVILYHGNETQWSSISFGVNYHAPAAGKIYYNNYGYALSQSNVTLEAGDSTVVYLYSPIASINMTPTSNIVDFTITNENLPDYYTAYQSNVPVKSGIFTINVKGKNPGSSGISFGTSAFNAPLSVTVNDHTYGETEIVISDDLPNGGQKQRTCSICGAVQTADLDDGWYSKDEAWYYFLSGKKTIGWKKINGKWYFMNQAGVMQTGLITDSGSTYYMSASGAMQTGWQQIGGNWYYFTSSGEMSTEWLYLNEKWYYLGMDGKMVTGSQTIDGLEYYFGTSGAMQFGWINVNGVYKYFNEDGYCESITGWQQIGTKWYYGKEDGQLAVGWLKISGKWYYFNTSGAMVTGWQQIDSKWYHFTNGGVMQTGWLQLSNKWYYLAPGGAMQTGWQQINGKWYYFNTSGAMLIGMQTINSKNYCFDGNGAMVTGWFLVNGNKYYAASSGALASGWYQEGEDWYYFNGSNVMQIGWMKINNKTYYFNEQGIMLIGWQELNGNTYYFAANGSMATGKVMIDGRLRSFDNNGVLIR